MGERSIVGGQGPGAVKGRRRRGFTLLELIGSMTILVLLFGCFYPALRGVQEAHARFASETYAIIILGNVVERVRGEVRRDPDVLEAILRDEYEKSPLRDDPRTRPVCTAGSDAITVSVLGARGAALARVEVPR